MKTIANNKKAYHDYEIIDTTEAGIVLIGSEVKAIRAGRVNLKDSFAKVINGEVFLFGMHISHLDTTNPHFKPEERRDRKLLLNKKEIFKLHDKIKTKGLTLVPTKLYFNQRNRAKIEIALCKGKNVHDKRDVLKEKSLQKEIQQQLKNFGG
jgi:SsrA-binding protein